MYEAMLGVMAVTILYLGVRIFMKLREMSSWETGDEPTGNNRRISISQDTLERSIEDPPASELGSTDQDGEKESNNGTRPSVSR